MLEHITLIALTSAFVLILMKKWGLVDHMQVYAPSKFAYQLFTCDFCMGFWIAMIITLTTMLLGSHMEWYVPIAAAPLIRLLV